MIGMHKKMLTGAAAIAACAAMTMLTPAAEGSDIWVSDGEAADTYDYGQYDTTRYFSGTWRDAYLSILNSDYSGDYAEEFSYGLIYVDGDDIPEMIVDTNVEAGGNQVFTFHDGTVDQLQTSRLGYCYIDHGNLFENADGNMGNYYDYFYSIVNGRWTQVQPGAYDAEAMQIASYYPREEMICLLRDGKTSSTGHRYEIVKEDCTWWEAKAKCEAKGGYLATLTSQEEFDKITEAIRNNGMTKYKFYVGANNNKTDAQWGYYWHDPLGEYYMLNDTFRPFWLEGEPSYTGDDANKNQVDEECVTLIYLKDGDYFCLNDVAYDLLGEAPYYKGTIGYICEYGR